MSEIKFRAWNGNKMIYDREGFKVVPSAHTPDKYFGMVYIKGNLYEGGEWAVDFKEGNLMQFIGLKDKNGKEIYEGDIVKFIFEGRKAVRYVGKIIFNSELGHFQIIFEGDNSCGVSKRDVAIIGNICESPELLGGRNETNK